MSTIPISLRGDALDSAIDAVDLEDRLNLGKSLLEDKNPPGPYLAVVNEIGRRLLGRTGTDKVTTAIGAVEPAVRARLTKTAAENLDYVTAELARFTAVAAFWAALRDLAAPGRTGTGSDERGGAA